MGVERRMRVVNGHVAAESREATVRVAFATSDMKHVDQHFGSAQSFAVYAVNPERIGLLEASQFGVLDQDGNEDKLAVKIETLQGCVAVYCQAVGASAIRQLVAHGIQPVKVSPGMEIRLVLDSLQEELRAGPSAWLATAIRRQGRDDTGRFDALASEGWEE